MWRFGLYLVCILLGSSGCLATLTPQRTTPSDSQVLSPEAPQLEDEPPTPRMLDVTVPLTDF